VEVSVVFSLLHVRYVGDYSRASDVTSSVHSLISLCGVMKLLSCVL
jgi:hypothetical protein